MAELQWHKNITGKVFTSVGISFMFELFICCSTSTAHHQTQYGSGCLSEAKQHTNVPIIILFIIVNLYKNKQYKITREKCNQASVVMGVTEHYLPTCKLFRTVYERAVSEKITS